MKYGELPLKSRIRGKTETVKFEGIIGRETERAIHFTFQDGTETSDGKKDTWFPLSQVVAIHRTRSVVQETLDSIVVTQWIAKQKGLV